MDEETILSAPLEAKIFLEGQAGAGKTTLGIRRTLALLNQGVPAESILVLTPQRTLQMPYRAALQGLSLYPDQQTFPAGGMVTLATIGGLARRLVELFWPLVGEEAGFAHPERPPVFLTIETAQYYMARLVRPLLESGYFESLTLDRNRLYAQILDDLNKAAVVGFPHTEIGERLDAAWFGDPAQRRVYADVQDCVNRFRAYCLEHNLLDFSLQLEILYKLLWHMPQVRTYLTRSYRHLIYDNIEEDVPVTHDLLLEWLPEFASALLIYDRGGGYRRFLGADPQSALRLAEACDERYVLDHSWIVNEPMACLNERLTSYLDTSRATPFREDLEQVGVFLSARFYPELLEAVCQEIGRLIQEDGIPPSEIVVLAPYLSDALRFALTSRLDELGIPWRSNRPSRSLRDEPATRCLITLAKLAHPAWKLMSDKFEVAYTFMQAIEGMDLVRAHLLTEIVYRPREEPLSSFDRIRTEVQERITFVLGSRYATLRNWLLSYRDGEPLSLDHFFRRLFGELLSQPGFRFHSDLEAVRVVASLIESAQKFRWAMEATDAMSLLELGREYLLMLEEGVIAAQYLTSWEWDMGEAVFLAPAYTFLLMNRPVRIQFWLDVGSSGWAERVYQPLTHPYVLSRTWMQEEAGRCWTDADEVSANRRALLQLVDGLLSRCRERVYFCLTNLGEQGFEQRGPLLKALWRMQLDRQRSER